MQCQFTLNRNGEYQAPPVPEYTKYIKQFIEENWGIIKQAFPIYQRLENIYRLSGLVNLINQLKTTGNLDNFTLKKEGNYYDKCVYVYTYPYSISTAGGLKGPEEFIKQSFIPFIPKIPVAPAVIKPENKVVEICYIERALGDNPVKFGPFHHAALLLKTGNGMQHITEYGIGPKKEAVLRHIQGDISNGKMEEDGHKWSITECYQDLKEYDVENIKKLMDIMIYDVDYFLPGNVPIIDYGANCQNIAKQILKALSLQKS
jgi:hypothetical protein